MAIDPSTRPFAESGALWCAVSSLGSLGGVWLAQQALGRASFAAAPAVGDWAMLLAGLYAWLLPIAAINLVLLQPGRAGDVATWRLAWGVIGLAWTLAAVLVFRHLLRRSDELERRLHLEAASFALFFGLVASVLYALFENRLPELRAEWVAVALLLSWWVGYLATARRYRWRA